MVAIALPDGGSSGEIATVSPTGIGSVDLRPGSHRGSHSNGALAGAKGGGTHVASIAGIGAGDGPRTGRGRGPGAATAGSGISLGTSDRGFGETASATVSSSPAVGGGRHRGEQQSAALGDGRGITGRYFKTADLTGRPVITRVDPVIGFSERTTPIDPALPTRYSVRWVGTIVPLYTETYTFSAGSDDGSRVSVNHQILIDMWKDQPILWRSGQIDLQAGKHYEIIVEYYEDGTGPAEMDLVWSSVHQAKGPIPTTQLYPE